MDHRASALASVLSLAIAAPVAAQDDVALGVPELATLEAMCEANAPDEGAQRLCLYVVRDIMLPAAGPEPDVADLQTIEGPEPVVYGLGDAQDRDGGRVMPLKVDWNVPPLTSWDKPRKGMKYVGVLVQHKAGQEGGSYEGWNWKVRDRTGFTYHPLTVSQARPALLSGDLEPRRTVRGWTTFEVPGNTRWLEIRHEPVGYFATLHETSDPLYWTVQLKKDR